MRRYSGLDKDSPESKWIDFKVIHSFVPNPSNLGLVEKVDLDYFIDKSATAVNQILYLQTEFETEIHHSVKNVQEMERPKISILAKDFVLELE